MDDFSRMEQNSPYAEKREFEREKVTIPFVYSLDEGETLADGQWREAETVDIGPVLVGGLGFHSSEPLTLGQTLRVALFMDLYQRDIWAREKSNFPVIYQGKVVRAICEKDGDYNIGVVFGGFAVNIDEPAESASS